MSSRKKLVLLAAMLVAILVLGMAMPAAAQLNTGNVLNTQGVVSDGSKTGDTSLTGTNSDSAASDATADIEEACRERITDVLNNEFEITLEDEDAKEALEELCDQ